jgi:hypothetical protein
MNLMSVTFYNSEEDGEVVFHYVESLSYCEEKGTFELYYRHPKSFSGYKEEKVSEETHMLMSVEVKEV